MFGALKRGKIFFFSGWISLIDILHGHVRPSWFNFFGAAMRIVHYNLTQKMDVDIGALFQFLIMDFTQLSKWSSCVGSETAGDGWFKHFCRVVAITLRRSLQRCSLQSSFLVNSNMISASIFYMSQSKINV